jgi:hypothetical protein
MQLCVRWDTTRGRTELRPLPKVRAPASGEVPVRGAVEHLPLPPVEADQVGPRDDGEFLLHEQKPERLTPPCRTLGTLRT